MPVNSFAYAHVQDGTREVAPRPLPSNENKFVPLVAASARSPARGQVDVSDRKPPVDGSYGVGIERKFVPNSCPVHWTNRKPQTS